MPTPISYFSAFEVKIDNDDGTTTKCVAQVVKVYDATHSVALTPDLNSDSNGIVAAGSLAVDPGTLIRFSFTRADGICGYAEIFTNATSTAIDTTPPTVAITAPASGATVAGTVAFSANAADDVGVAGVQFQVDGANIGA